MNTAKFLQYCVYILGLSTSFATYAYLSHESDAMQMTTNFNNLTSISCDPQGQHCIAVGFRDYGDKIDHLVYITEDEGITWSTGTPLVHPVNEDLIPDPEGSLLNQMKIQCNETGTGCLIAGSSIISGRHYLLTYVSHDGGHQWSEPHLTSLLNNNNERFMAEDYPFLSLKCNPSLSQCLIAANVTAQNKLETLMFTTQDGGSSWSDPLSLVSPTGEHMGIKVFDLACSQSKNICTALASTFTSESDPISAFLYSTHDGGKSWSGPKPMLLTPELDKELSETKNDFFTHAACDDSGLTCVALGVHNNISEESAEMLDYSYVTKNGGSTWHHATEIDPYDKDNIFTAINCDTTMLICAAVGFSFKEIHLTPIIYITIDGGNSWQKKPFTALQRSTGFMDVFCSVNSSLCHAVGFVESK